VLVGLAIGRVLGDAVIGIGMQRSGEAHEGQFAVHVADSDTGSVLALAIGGPLFARRENEVDAAAVAPPGLRHADGDARQVEGQVEPHHPGTRLEGSLEEHLLHELAARPEPDGPCLRTQSRLMRTYVALQDPEPLGIGLREVIGVEEAFFDTDQALGCDATEPVRAEEQRLGLVRGGLGVEDEHGRRF